MDTGDAITFLETVALAGTWYWALRRPISFDGNRRKLAVLGLGFASLAVLLDLTLTIIMHFHSNPDDVFAAKVFLVVFMLVTLSALAGLICGIVGKGTPRVAAIIWSTLMLAFSAVTLLQLVMQRA